VATSIRTALGSVESIWRYPVKSMLGERLDVAELTERGVLGDRAYALVDRADGKVASAKNPRKWPRLFEIHATFVEPPRVGGGVPAVRIKFPDGSIGTSGEAGIDQKLSGALGREVKLESSAATGAAAEEYWPDIEGLDHRDAVTEFALPEGTFFDGATIHLLTTATLARLGELYPQGRFDVCRFRPNIVIESSGGANGFVENEWIGQTLAIGDAVRLNITAPCLRCVMTTLAQDDLPKDIGILRTAAQHNRAAVGVYASVLRDGTIRAGDSVGRV